MENRLVRIGELTRLFPTYSSYTFWHRRLVSGKVPGFQVGNAWLIRLSDAEAYVASLNTGGDR